MMARQRRNPHTEVHPDPHQDSYEDDWQEPDPLDAPAPPPGYSYRWIRDMSPDGRPDSKRLLQARRQGYEPVSPEQVDDPAYKMLAHEGRIRVDELVLMQISDQHRERLARPIRRATATQQEAVKQNLFRDAPKNQYFGQPEYRAKSTVTRGRVAIADDD